MSLCLLFSHRAIMTSGQNKRRICFQVTVFCIHTILNNVRTKFGSAMTRSSLIPTPQGNHLRPVQNWDTFWARHYQLYPTPFFAILPMPLLPHLTLALGVHCTFAMPHSQQHLTLCTFSFSTLHVPACPSAFRL